MLCRRAITQQRSAAIGRPPRLNSYCVGHSQLRSLEGTVADISQSGIHRLIAVMHCRDMRFANPRFVTRSMFALAVGGLALGGGAPAESDDDEGEQAEELDGTPQLPHLAVC